ncbi:Receptor-type tyrosine-protein phosphatase R [Papilio xuthus]|uniref:Receptor-type tyrosine-protein phosphatase R n=1 Tax=Papilio xuthus TaxID=66420 RepID=A0A194PUC2_PAPXU|nr:Receptor-type tyrosine-protein phosphatase R [Papilio xuthus]
MLAEVIRVHWSTGRCEGRVGARRVPGGMWGAAAGWWCGALAAALLLLLVALRCRRPGHKQRHLAWPHRPLQVHQVHIVSSGKAYVSHLTIPEPRCAHTKLAGAPPDPVVTVPSDPPPSAPRPDPPQIVIVKNFKQNTIAHEAASSESRPPPLPRLSAPEHWLHKRPFDYKYPCIPRPLTQLVNTDLGADLSRESRAKKYSATRSPSLEKDDKSPLVSAGTHVEVFGFDDSSVSKMSDSGDVPSDMSPSNLRRFRSVSTRLNMCSVTEATHVDGIERVEMQNSPRVIECSSAKDKSSASKFDFSPKLLGDTISSPRFFTPPEMASPAFFAEPSPKSVYYDTVRSPKFFPETPRDAEVPQSPRTLSDHINRANGLCDKPGSPKFVTPRPSPKVHSYNKENYFTFEQGVLEDGALRASPRPKRYGGRYSIERERFTPPADKEVKKYKRHNSCDTNIKNNEEIMPKYETKESDSKIEVVETDVVDCCVKVDSMKIEIEDVIEKTNELVPVESSSAQARRQRLKSISLDSDNAKIIEQNLGLPIAKQMKDQMNEAYKNQETSTSCENMEMHITKSANERPAFKFDVEQKNKPVEQEEPKSPDVIQRKTLRQSSDTQSFLDMPRFSPKEFEITVTSEEGSTVPAETQTKRKGKNLRNLTIDLSKRDTDLEKELLEFEKLYTDAEEKKVKTPTLKVKATSLDSSESVNLSLPQKKSLDIPQNSISVPNTPKRQLKRILAQRSVKHDGSGGKMGYNSLQSNAEQRRLYMKGQDSGIFLRDNHASLMLYQAGPSRMGSRTMGSFEENTMDLGENTPEINISGADNRPGLYVDSGQTLGSNLLNYKQNLSVSSTNLKTLPEGVPSDDFEPSTGDEKLIKKLYRRNSNQSLMLSTHSLQSSNCSLSSAGTSAHNLGTVRTSFSNFSLNSDRQKKLSIDRRDSNASLVNAEHTSITPTTRVICSSNTNLSGEVSKNCLLQRRGSNNSLTLNISTNNNLSRHSSNSSLNKEVKLGQKKGLLERRSSNTSLTLNINTSNPQLSTNRGLSISNYNLNGSTCNLSRYNSNHSIDNAPTEPRKGILERRSSNTSLALNIQPQEPRDIEIDETLIDGNLTELPHRERHRKSLSTENLIPKSYKNRMKLRTSENAIGFGSHDNLWSTSYASDQEYSQNLTFVCGDQENEIIYAFGRQEDPNFQPGFVRNITTKPLSPQTTSEEFRLYLANMHHLQNASSVLTRQQLKDLNDVFQNGYSKVKCHSTGEGQHCCSGRVDSDIAKENPQTVIPEPVTTQPCSEYQKMLLRNLHQEFWDMPTNFQEKPIVSGSHTKNRYKTILPNEHSRFMLRPDPGTSGAVYINANYIKGHEYTKNSYIATQGPLQNTIYDFWMMIRQNVNDFLSQKTDGSSDVTIQKIVMLTNFIENNRQKCEKYFPLELNEEITITSPELSDMCFFSETESTKRSFVIKNTGLVKKAGYTIRKLNVRHLDSKSEGSDSELTVYHYWFHNWADHKCPKDVNALLNLSLDVLKDQTYTFSESDDEKDEQCHCNDSPKPDSKFVFPPLEGASVPCPVTVKLSSPVDLSLENKSPPTIVHCSAGIGRTGCLIAILNGIKQLTNEQKVDVLGIVCNMRLNRGGMVQNSEQYELIHKVLCLFEQACLPSL